MESELQPKFIDGFNGFVTAQVELSSFFSIQTVKEIAEKIEKSRFMFCKCFGNAKAVSFYSTTDFE